MTVQEHLSEVAGLPRVSESSFLNPNEVVLRTRSSGSGRVKATLTVAKDGQEYETEKVGYDADNLSEILNSAVLKELAQKKGLKPPNGKPEIVCSCGHRIVAIRIERLPYS